MRGKLLYIITFFLIVSCTYDKPSVFNQLNELPNIYPDYIGVTIPCNISPLHFELLSEAEDIITCFKAGDIEVVCGGKKVLPTMKQWRNLISSADKGRITVELYAKKEGVWERYLPFVIYVSKDKIDPYISYRLIAPSYVAYEDLTINQRNLETFDEEVIYDNMLGTVDGGGQCINCHSYQNGNPQRMQFHVRQDDGGTVIAYDGKYKKVNLKTDSTMSAGVYPAWHPTLPLIAYSNDLTFQNFHTRSLDKIEVFDIASALVLYDIEKDEVMLVEDYENEYEIFPSWSPDGEWLYYCSAHFEIKDTSKCKEECSLRYKEFKYNVYRRKFHYDTMSFGDREKVLDADSLNVSATLPRISPDGKFLLLSVGEYGCFHIWHKAADLWIMDLDSMKIRPMTEVNSNDVEAYHTWSSNGKWIMFSSRRNDGNYTIPFFAHVDEKGFATKPFELPQKDPERHRQMMKCYNIPEFMNGPVTISPQTFLGVIKTNAVSVKYVSR